MAIAPPKFHEGSLVELKAEFANDSGTPMNPTTVTLKYRLPDGTVVTKEQAELTNDSAGVWTYNLDTTGLEVGLVTYKFYGTGAVTAAEESSFDLVSPSGFISDAG